MGNKNSASAVAIIGMACYYPGAYDLRQFWENILARRRQFRKMPVKRLPLADYYDPDPSIPDKTYCDKAALIDGFKFDWISHRIPKSTIESTDTVHWLALEVALQSLKDAGFNRENVPVEHSGVILGNTLTGEHSRAEGLRLRWPFVRRTLESAAKAKGLPIQMLSELLQTMEVYYKSVFAPVTEDTLAGGLSNTIAGRVCNYLDFHGGGYTVDGACSSSLLAVATSATALINGDLDLALAGGVDISLDTFELIGFAKTSALTMSDMRVYDRRANGFIPGEGCGFVVLKRLNDAIADGNYIYAVLRGWGISSDGKGGLTAPSVKGQAAALRRAYDRAGYSPLDLDFIEGHGTGTVVGDRTELEAISMAMGNTIGGNVRSCGITSLKSIIGHTKAASGIGGFIKAVIAVNRRVLPPTANCSDPNHVFEKSVRSVYPILTGEIRPRTEKLKAGISAMGFGGINCHVTIESRDKPSAHLMPLIEEHKLLVSNQETELFVLGASSVPDMIKLTRAVKQRAQDLTEGELIDLAAQLCRELKPDIPVRAGIVAGNPETFLECLQDLEKTLNENPPHEGVTVISPRQDMFIGNNIRKSRVGFLFPGQGSQFLNMGRTLVERHDWAQKLLSDSAVWLEESGGGDIARFIFRPLDKALDDNQIKIWSEMLKQTEIVQPAICLTSLLWIQKLDRLGIRPVAAGGHSLGELTAFYAAGSFDESALLKMSSIRGQAMAAPGDKSGIMASLACSQESAVDILSKVNGYAVIANINSPRQVVISGERSSVEEAVNTAKDRDIRTHILQVSNAFHSRFVSSAADLLRSTAPIPKILGSIKMNLVSGMSGREITSGINLHDHFANQVLSQVDFVSLVEEMVKDCDLILEVGPGKVLTNLASAIIKDDKRICRPVESKQGRDRDLNVFLADFFVHGGDVKWEALYEDRLVRQFVPASERVFIENPCERPYKVSASESLQTATEDSGTFVSALADKVNIPPEVLDDYLSRRYRFIEAIIRADLENLPSYSQSATISSTDVRDSSESVEIVAGVKQPETAGNAVPDTASVLSLLFELVEKRTGFPGDSLSMELRLLDDLNLDSIKAAELIAEASMRLGIAGELDVSQYANATLKEVASAIDRLKKKQGPTAATAIETRERKDKPTWVRNFVVKPVIEELTRTALKGEAGEWKKKNMLILSEPNEQDIAGTLGRQLAGKGAGVKVTLFEDARVNGLSGNDEFTDFIAVLPRIPEEPGLDNGRLAVIIDRLRSIASPPVSNNDKRRKTVAYIQFGGGYFGAGPEASHIEQCAALSLAASLHFERPDLKVRVLDFNPAIKAAQMAKKIMSELLTPDSYSAVGYDTKLTRHVLRPRLQEPSDYQPRPISWTSDDVILVTGGAKGITAECSLALAQATNVRMALVGSSPHPGENPDPGESGEIGQTLKRFGDSGLTARYYRCNIVDANNVDRLVKQIRQELGNITGVIHGSALNKPGDLDKVSTEDALSEVAPKVMGAANLCNALKDSPPKLLIGFSSIIGVSGMIRNAWYGFSNEALNLMLCQFKEDHPETSVLSIAFSIWDDVGMGVRMGSTKYLARMGIGAIPAEEGVRRFLQLVMNDPGEKQVVVAARIAGLDTFQPEIFPLPAASRFLEKIVYYYPEVEVVARAHLNIERDFYVKDHIWRGTYLFPTVFGLEAMAQAVAYVTGESKLDSIRIEDILLERPIPVNPENGTEIEIRAEVLERGAKQTERRVRIGISTDQTGFTIEHFSATFVLNVKEKAPEEKVVLPEIPLEIHPGHDLYNGKLLFQGPLFQRLKQIYSLNPKKCVFRSELNSLMDDYKKIQTTNNEISWLAGDPYFRDSLLHSAQLPVSQDISLPVKIKSIERYRPEGGLSEPLTGVAVIEDRNDREIFARVYVVDEGGHVVERISGYVLRILEHHEDYPTPEEIADPGKRDEKIIREAIKKRAGALGLEIPEISAAFIPGLHQLTKKERHKKELPVLRKTIGRKFENKGDLPKDIKVRWLESGKPRVEGTSDKDIDISLSHDENTMLCVAGSGPQGCDIASVSGRKKQEWIALLGSANEHLLQQLAENGDSIDRAGTRIWAAAEAFRKATNFTESNFTIEMQTDDTVVFRSNTSNGDLQTLTFPVRLTRGPEKVVAIVTQSESDKKARIPDKEKNLHVENLNFNLDSYSSGIANGPQGQPLFVFRFPLTFKEASNPSRTLYFCHYFAWIGKLREYAIHPIYEKLVEMFSTGKWGMVTNHAETQILGEAVSGDVIEGRLWLDKVYGSAQSTLEFCFEWRKTFSNGNQELIAVSKMSTTWVAIKGHGVVEVKPLPEFGQEFVNKLLPPSDQKQAHYTPTRPMPSIDCGKELYAEPAGPVKTSSLLQEQIFETTLEDANLVGNIYFSNYYLWQGRVRDNFLNKIAPEFFGGSGEKGELRCINCKVNHISEAMPFDRIAVRMYRSAVFERGLNFYFDYYRITANGKHHKLGYGEHEAVWFAPNKEGKWVSAELPLTLRGAIIPKDKPIRSSYTPLRQSGKNNKYDVIVVGAGIGGLTAGALLAKQGKRVLVVEQHDKPGGFCTSWERFVKYKNKKLRFVFDAGVHDIAAVGNNRRIPYLLKELDVQDRIEWLRVSHEYFFPDFKMKIPHRVEDYIKELCKHFPNERDGLAAFFKEAEICCREFYSLFDIKSAERQKIIQKSHFFRWSNVSLIDMIGEYTRDPMLKQVLSLIAHYLTDDLTALNASVGIPLYAYYIDGGYYPRGSSQVLSNTLVDAINRYGSTVKLRNAVSHILIKDRHVRGVQLANGEVFYADTVVSNADIRLTFLKLIGREHLPASFSRQIENLRPSNSAFMVFLGVDFIPDTNPITYIKDEAGVTAIMIPSKVDPSLAPPGYSCVTLAKLIPHEQAVTWDRGNPRYSKRKQQFGDQLIALAEKAIPGLKDHIIYRQEASPATFARYAWTTKGAIYALAIDEWRPPMKTSIKGLYLAGSGTSVRPGVEDAVYSGIRAAESVIKEEQKIHKDI